MPKKICPNGHVYDSTIYGKECPLCPKGASAPQSFSANTGEPMEPAGAGTRVTPPAADAFGATSAPKPQFGGDAAGATILNNNNNFSTPRTGQPAQPVGGGTVIRQPKGMASPQKGRKLVGFLVTYNRNPQGKAYEIYEGKNYIGRDRNCDICIPDDNQMSGRHMSILYRNVDNKFKYRDEQSSNGSFVNKELSDEGELQNFDIIRLGNSIFIFIAIPQLG